ncbi:MAG TPA: histidine kinase dimerization/phospho-acceptor domain-containing protein, partial [Pirellulales bacterium]|nr:histidine kinase dimerization/phospho-acceptor domain-containing protein [Pirellulales bacterium]
MRKLRFAAPLGIQIAFLTCLFLGSLAALAYDVFRVRTTPQLERLTRQRLLEASSAMAEAAANSATRRPLPVTLGDWNAVGRELSEISDRVLSRFDGVEGGFYLDGDADRFVGYAFPTDRPQRKRRSDKNEPPPLEEPYIRVQAHDCLVLPAGEYSASVHDVGPSRVMIVTEPVGEERPATAATWVMYRLVSPRMLDRQVRRSQVSTGLALAGLLLALGLTARLGLHLKRQQREQNRLRDELRRSERLAALGKLLAGVAHEIRNPLAAIRSTVQLWQRLPEQARTPESLEAVIRSVDRLNETVTQLLRFSRTDSLDRQPVDVHLLLRDTLELFAVQATRQGVELKAAFDERLPSVIGSDPALRQVFVNLIANALDAMPSGGQLEVTTRFGDSGKFVTIDFADSGEGVPPEIAAHLFEPFFTTRPQGTGLG